MDSKNDRTGQCLNNIAFHIADFTPTEKRKNLCDKAKDQPCVDLPEDWHEQEAMLHMVQHIMDWDDSDYVRVVASSGGMAELLGNEDGWAARKRTVPRLQTTRTRTCKDSIHTTWQPGVMCGQQLEGSGSKWVDLETCVRTSLAHNVDARYVQRYDDYCYYYAEGTESGKGGHYTWQLSRYGKAVLVHTPGESVGAHLTGSGKKAWVDAKTCVEEGQKASGATPGSPGFRYIQHANGVCYFYAAGSSSGRGGNELYRLDLPGNPAFYEGATPKRVKMLDVATCTKREPYALLGPHGLSSGTKAWRSLEACIEEAELNGLVMGRTLAHVQKLADKSTGTSMCYYYKRAVTGEVREMYAKWVQNAGKGGLDVWRVVKKCPHKTIPLQLQALSETRRLPTSTLAGPQADPHGDVCLAWDNGSDSTAETNITETHGNGCGHTRKWRTSARGVSVS